MADRKASVALELKAGQFKAEATVVEGKVEGIDRKVEKLDRDITKIPPDAAKAAAAMKLLGDDATKAALKLEDLGKSSTSMGLIDQRIAHTRGELRRLADEFNRTGDAGTLQKLFKAGDELKGLERLSKKLASSLDEGGKQGSRGVLSALQGVLSTPVLGPITAGALIAGAVAAAPFVGAAIGGAVSGVFAFGGVFAGAFTELKTNPQVQAAGKDFLAWLGSEWKIGTASFAEPLIDAFSVLKTDLAGPLDDLKKDFAYLAPYVRDFAMYLGAAVEKFMPGFNRMIQSSGPILTELGHGLVYVGDGLNVMFDEISKGGKGEVEALDVTFRVLGGTLAAIGFFVRAMANSFDWITQVEVKVTDFQQSIFGWIPLLGDYFRKAHEIWSGVSNSFDDAGPAVGRVLAPMNSLTREVDNQKRAVDGLTSAWDKWFGVSMNVNEATLQYNQDLTRLTESIKDNGRHWELNTKAGQDNYGALLQAIQGAHDLRQAQIDSGISAAQANDTYQRSIDLLLALASKAGLSASQVQSLHAQVGGLKGSLDSLPPTVATTVTAPGLDPAMNKTKTFREMLDALNGKTVQSYINVQVRNFTASSLSGHGGQGQASSLNRWGGVYLHAAEGALRQADVFSPASPARYAFAEPATGGEAFVPRYGDYARSMGILDQAARWYGARAVPGGGGSASVTTINLTVNAGMGTDGHQVGRQIADALRPYVERSGGSVQQAVMRRAG